MDSPSAPVNDPEDTIAVDLYAVVCTYCGEETVTPVNPAGNNNTAYCLDCILNEQALR